MGADSAGASVANGDGQVCVQRTGMGRRGVMVECTDKGCLLEGTEVGVGRCRGEHVAWRWVGSSAANGDGHVCGCSGVPIGRVFYLAVQEQAPPVQGRGAAVVC